MQEYELYVPLHDNRGKEIEPSRLDGLKRRLLDRFGGFTHFPQESEGEWKLGGQTFRDRIVIIRVLAGSDAATKSWFCKLKTQLAAEYDQESFLITVRSTRAL